MKAIYRIIIAIFATAALAVSCSKDAVPVDEAQAKDGGPRVITLSFGDSVKSTLDGFTPKFSAGDRIMLSNGTRTEECTVSVDAGGKATVTTTLTGVLNAVSPASAAVKAGGGLTYKVPATQSGAFADAAIATAQAIIGAAEFEIQVSLLKFYVDKSIKVKSIKVTGPQNLATEGSSDLKQITVGNGYSYLHNVADDPQQRLCYAAVLPGVPASSLKFTSDTDTQGTVERQSPASTVTLAANTLYKAFIPYYIQIGSQKWAYCNIGAFLPEEAGKYFAWGETEGRVAATTGANAFAAKPFNWANAPFNNGSSSFDQTYFDGQKSTVCPDGILDIQYDAANVNWGGYWRMPTGGSGNTRDFTVLLKACDTQGLDIDKYHYTATGITDVPAAKGIYRYSATGEVAGVYFVDGEGNKLFFPLAGYSLGDGLSENVTNAYYWSSTLKSDGISDAWYLQFPGGSIRPISWKVRHCGAPIRPIADL